MPLRDQIEDFIQPLRPKRTVTKIKPERSDTRPREREDEEFDPSLVDGGDDDDRQSERERRQRITVKPEPTVSAFDGYDEVITGEPEPGPAVATAEENRLAEEARQRTAERKARREARRRRRRDVVDETERQPVERETVQEQPSGPDGVDAQETLTTLLIKPWWHVEIIERLRRIDFEPVPSVDPVVLWLARRPMPLVPNLESELYRQFIEGSFARRGRTVRQCLNQALTHRQLRRMARDLRFDLADTPSALHFDQWLGIYRFLSTVVRQGKPMRI